jgi:hypothetical protein
MIFINLFVSNLPLSDNEHSCKNLKISKKKSCWNIVIILENTNEHSQINSSSTAAIYRRNSI